MKHVFLILFFLSLPMITWASAEEEKCFLILHEAVKTDNRYTDFLKNGLENVVINERSGLKADLNVYGDFTKHLVKNPDFAPNKAQREARGFTQTDFLSRRTNIATVVTNNTFNVSQWVGFGRDSNFTYPLTQKTNPQLGDRWTINATDPFKEFVLYTHHNILGEFMSCGLIRIVPLGKNDDGGDRKYSEISEAGYMTNILNGVANQKKLGNKKCNSGFEGNSITNSVGKFYKMKTNICVLDFAQEDYLTIQLLAVAYNNQSQYLNEYVTFPLQVKAMKDTGSNPTGGLLATRNTFLYYLDKNTCLSLLHPTLSSLPSFCNGKYSSSVNISGLYSMSQHPNWLAYLIPQALAKRDFHPTTPLIEESKGMKVYENFPYEAYKKIQALKDEDLKTYLNVALNPQFDKYIEHKIQNEILLTPFEETFQKCGISLTQRMEIILDMIEKNPNLNLLKFNEMSYKDPRFGDCIIPYPDKTHLAEVIPDSFESNQILAKQIQSPSQDPEVDENMLVYAQSLTKISSDYNKKIQEISDLFHSGTLNAEAYQKQLDEQKTLYNSAITTLNQQFDAQTLATQAKQNRTQVGEDATKSPQSNSFLIFGGILLLGLLLVLGTFFLKHKTK